MEQDTVLMPSHLVEERQTYPSWALVCLGVGILCLVFVVAFLATVAAGRFL